MEASGSKDARRAPTAGGDSGGGFDVSEFAAHSVGIDLPVNMEQLHAGMVPDGELARQLEMQAQAKLQWQLWLQSQMQTQFEDISKGS